MPVAAFLLLAVAALLPARMAEAASMDGRYQLTPDADCTQSGDAGLLRIEDDVFYGTESQCRMTNPIDVRDMSATLYDMVCVGEGTAWTERAIMVKGAEDQLILVWDGYAFAYPRCPGPTVRPRARPAED